MLRYRERFGPFAIGFTIWLIPALLDLATGGYGVASDSLLFWIIAAPLGAVAAYKLARESRRVVKPALYGGLGTAVAILVMSLLYAAVRDEADGLGTGMQGFPVWTSVAFFLAIWAFFALLYTLPLWVGRRSGRRSDDALQRV